MSLEVRPVPAAIYCKPRTMGETGRSGVNTEREQEASELEEVGTETRARDPNTTLLVTLSSLMSKGLRVRGQ